VTGSRNVTPYDVVRRLMHGHHEGEASRSLVLTGRHAARYDRFAAGWALGWLYRAVAAQVLADVPRGGTLLDVGTGPGRLLLEVARRRPDLHAVGVDPSADMVEHALRRCRAAGLSERTEAKFAAAESLPFPDGSFDTVVSTLSAHHWADVAAGVAEQLRVLRAGGHLWVYDLRGASSAEVPAALRAQVPAPDVTQRRVGFLPGLFLVCHQGTKPAESSAAAG
jgi:ubiquinone/menaquinone biosynthesis C-methylase UbiE